MKFCLVLVLVVGLVDMQSVDTEEAVVKRDSVCYGNLGCFATDALFTSPERPLSVIPESPDKIVTKFLLYTRESETVAEQLDARHPETAKDVWVRFHDRPTQILIHGYLDSVSLTTMWMFLKDTEPIVTTGKICGKKDRERQREKVLSSLVSSHGRKPTDELIYAVGDRKMWRCMIATHVGKDMKEELLTHGDYNVVLVDWSNGNRSPYDQASANARVVGAQIAALVKSLISEVNVSAASFHIIGHSLGAHVCGYAGEKISGLGRITGLDPAGPNFENTDKMVRLDETDALFVDIIHTDAFSILQLELGTKTQSGHADFYPNMGRDQPECTNNLITNIIGNGIVAGIEKTTACSHIRAVSYFTESINTKCPFLGFPCASEDDFKNNLCHTCTEDGCSRLGFNADKHKPAPGKRVKYYLSTQGHKPFCLYHLTVTLKLNTGHGDAERGVLDLVLTGDGGSTGKIPLTGDSDPANFSPGHTYKFYVMAPINFGNVQSATFTWTHMAAILDPLHRDILGLQHPKLYLDEIDIYRDEAGVDVHLCASGQSFETGKSLTISSTC